MNKIKKTKSEKGLKEISKSFKIPKAEITWVYGKLLSSK